MADHQDPQEEIVVTRDGRIKGCRGRVLVAVVAVALLLLAMLAMLVYSMLSGPLPQPVRRAAADAPAAVEAAPSDPTAIA